jgi:hypothetical protein
MKKRKMTKEEIEVYKKYLVKLKTTKPKTKMSYMTYRESWGK